MKKLTKAEEEIMQIVWEQGESTVGSVRDYLSAQTGGKKPPHSTISTMLRILADKGFLEFRAYGRTHVYTPAVSKSQYSKQSLRRLVSDYFGGSTNRLVSASSVTVVLICAS